VLATVRVYVVVEVGLTLAEPLAALDLMVPGVMVMLVAFVVTQVKVALAPEVMLAGLALKEVIVGLLDFFDGECFAWALAGNARQVVRARSSAQKAVPEDLSRMGVWL